MTDLQNEKVSECLKEKHDHRGGAPIITQLNKIFSSIYQIINLVYMKIFV